MKYLNEIKFGHQGSVLTGLLKFLFALQFPGDIMRQRFAFFFSFLTLATP